MTLSLSALKEYLKVDYTDEDTTIQAILDAAVSHIETILNRPILDANMTAETTWTVPESIRIAVYMLCSHWYENRTVIGTVTEEMAFSVNALIRPHKYYNI